MCLIREGRETIALQEAQFSPPLMKTLEAIVFPRSSEWHELLKANGFDPPADLDSSHISLMRELYTKPINGSDPLYQDLAHAMRTKNFENALLVLRLIRKKNPSDTNAVEQVAKLETRIQSEKLSILVQLARDNDEDGFSDLMGLFLSEPWENKQEGAEWEEVVLFHDKLERKRSLIHCKQMIESLIPIKEENDWEEARILLNSIYSLQNLRNFNLDIKVPEMDNMTYSGIVSDVENWSKDEYQKNELNKDNEIRLTKLKKVVRAIQDKEFNKKQKVSEMRDDLNQLTSIARDLQEAKQSLEPEDLSNFNKTLSKLRTIFQKQRGFRFFRSGMYCFTWNCDSKHNLYFRKKQEGI